MATLPKKAGLEENGGTEKLVAAIERRRDELGLASPWSIAELRLDDEDYDRLNFWAATLDKKTVRQWAEDDWSRANLPTSTKRTRRGCLGLLLLAIAAEGARREATQATLWRYVRQRPDQSFRFRADGILFVQGQPGWEFKVALEAAVKEFGLRHVMEAVDSKRYYLTVLLQFGFGIRDAEQRLSAWLAGQDPKDAIKELSARGGRLASESFAALWRDLRLGRGSRLLPTESLRQRLHASPWVLPGWVEALIGLIGRSRPGPPSSGPVEPPGRLDAILGPPRLTWPGGGVPYFSCKITDLAKVSLPGCEYTLRNAGRVVARIERDGDDLKADRDAITIAGFPVIAALELKDEESGAGESLSVECFDPREPALLFDLRSGRPVASTAPLEPSGRYALVFADDLTLSPEPEEWRAVRSGLLRLKIAALSGDARATRLTTLDGAAVWEARSPSDSTAAPKWADVSLEVVGKAGSASLPMGRPYELAIRHPEDVCVTFARRGMEPQGPRPQGPGITLVGPITSAVPAVGQSAKWLIGLERAGNSARIMRDFQPDQHGGAIFRGEGWEALDPHNPLDAGDARRSPLLIAPPTTWDNRPVRPKEEIWAVMEGEDWVDVPGTKPRVIPRLSGLGGPLTVRLGPFNAVPAFPPDGGPKRLDALILAARVVDRGIVRSVLIGEATEEAHACRIELAYEVEIGEEHEVHWWDRSGEVHRLRPSSWPLGEPTRHDWWSMAPPLAASEPRALLVTYAGRRIGAWWSADWAAGLAEVAAVRDPGSIADLICRAKLPVLEDRSLPEARRLAERWPVDVLRPWLSDEAPDGWRFVVRAAFRDWRPRPEQAERLATALDPAAEFPESATAFRLLDVCPVLMGRYLRARAGDASREMRMLCRMIRPKIEEDLRFEVCEHVGTEESVHDGLARLTGLDPAFLKTLNARGVSAVLDLPAVGEFDQRRNLDLAATQFTACRLLLALDILQSLEDGDLSHWKGGRCGTA